ncbi:helix-turn-helix domain-containing protein [Streptomyces tubercidicus]
MALQHPSAPSRASSAVPRPTARSGVVHVNARHATRYTVVGNHLAQHRELSLLAIGLAVHIQSLPAGARIGIKVLTARFPESEHRIAGAPLSELHRHEPRLLLAERDVHRLTPAAAAWLERGAAPEAVQRTLIACLPDDLKHPAALLAHRLTALLPPRPAPATPVVVRPDPLQTCECCDRAFRAPEPGHCRDCRSERRKAA